MKHTSIDGVIIYTQKSGDHDLYLTVLSAERGRFLMLSKGGRGFSNPKTALSQEFVFGNFEYYCKGDANILKCGEPERSFFALGTDLPNLWLATYLGDVMREVTEVDTPAHEELRLMLNTLHVIEAERRPREIIKGAFEWRVACMAGYAPDLSTCHTCGTSDAEGFYLNVMSGELICESCLGKKGVHVRARDAGEDEVHRAETLCPVTPSVLAALRYVKEAPLSRLFSFALKDEEEIACFARVTETYLLSHLGKGFQTLDNYYKNIRELQTMLALSKHLGTSE